MCHVQTGPGPIPTGMETALAGVLSAEEFAEFPPDTLNAALDDAWSTRSLATDRACRIYTALILSAVREHVPDVVEVILREDTSHLPAHGHVDAIINSNGENIMEQLGDWHELEWVSDVDENVWDIYHLAPHLFIRTGPDGIRRLTLTSTTSPKTDLPGTVDP